MSLSAKGPHCKSADQDDNVISIYPINTIPGNSYDEKLYNCYAACANIHKDDKFYAYDGASHLFWFRYVKLISGTFTKRRS